MAVSTATITMDLADQLGVDFDTRRTKVWVTTNVPGDTIVDTAANKIRLGSGTVTVNTDGTASVVVWVPGVDSNPASWQTTIHVDYPDRNQHGGRGRRDFGPYTITASGDLADLVPEQEVPAAYLTTVTAQLDAKVAAANAAADRATKVAAGDLSATYSVDPIGYDIVILAGQSNMSGRGTPYSASTDPANPRILQWKTHSTTGIQPATEPLDMYDTPTGIGPGLQFARWYAARRLTPNRKVLLVPVARGGTPLVSNASPLGWRRGVAGNLYDNMISQAQAALASANATPGTVNRFVGLLWCQGETDGDNNVTGDAYLTDLDALFNGVRTDLGVSDLPIVVQTMVPEYLSTGTRSQINAVHRDTPNRIARTDVALGASSANLGDGNHYSAAGQRLNGRAVYDAYERISEGLAPYAEVYRPVTPVLTLGTVTASSVALSWAAVTGATSYQIAYRTSGGTWTNGPSVTATTGTVTGLSGSTAYEFRVAALSAAGIYSANSNVVTTTTPASSSTLGVTASPAGAYSVSRKINSVYTGPLVKVRRSSDNTESDIAQSSGVLDTAALSAFLSGSDGFVSVIYDQSGNARHLTQTTTTSQPKIATAGTLVTSGTKAALTFDGTDDVLFRTSSLGLVAAPGATSCFVVNAANPGTAKRAWAESSIGSGSGQYGHAQPESAFGTPVIENTTGAVLPGGTKTIYNSAIHQVSSVDTTTAISQWVDGVSDLAAAAYTRSGTSTKDRFAIGGVVRSGSLASFAMTFSELVLWPSALNTADRQAAEANQKAYYGTP